MNGGREITGATRVVGVIGDPVGHSRSPAMHNAAFDALGLDWVYVAFPVARGDGAAAVRAVVRLGLAGLNVTMPHKADAAAACDDLAPAAAALGAVNTVVNADDVLIGHSTDGDGFVRALDDEGIELSGQRALVVGAGGAGRAITHALGRASALVTVAARRPEAARSAASLAPDGVAVGLDGLSVEGFEVIVNATPLGMDGETPPFDTAKLHTGQFVYDTVYPVETPLLREARARGLRAAGGLGMLVHQGALSFSLWTGVAPPLDVMRAAASARRQ
ncbi:MAG TPA: shikimate dehydrogenase [Acidimicrobiia bacterium]|nr:shikimate dehydrogenase [Acidimicrobiia bacterium]